MVITGAGGFIGSRLACQLLAEADFADARLTLCDLKVQDAPPSERVRVVEGDLQNPYTLIDAIDGRADIVVHFAGILGGAAEADYPLSRKVNIDGSLNLLEALQDVDNPPRVILASSVAVFGPPLPQLVNDDTMPVPVMHYGGQKRMIEIAIEQFSARGSIDGVAIRLPGIIARRGADARLKSAFLNTMFYDYADGKDFTLPVSPEGTIWLISVATCVEAFIHAAGIPRAALGQRRAFNLPAQRASMSDLVAALGVLFPESRSKVSWQPDAALEALFTRQPLLETKMANSLGFKHDGTIENLVKRAIQE